MVETREAEAQVVLEVSGENFWGQIRQWFIDRLEPFPINLTVSVSDSNPDVGDTVVVSGNVNFGSIQDFIEANLERAIGEVFPEWSIDLIKTMLPSISEMVTHIESFFGINIGGGVAGKNVLMKTNGVNKGFTTTDKNGRFSFNQPIPQKWRNQTITLKIVIPKQASPVTTKKAETIITLGVGNGNGGNGGNGNGDGEEEGLLGLRILLLAWMALSGD